MIAFGPVPSRRLGKSIGINNIPPKICTYSCVYCQLGQAIQMDIAKQTFYSVNELVNAVLEKIDQDNNPSSIDYLTFVPDGEPTLDINLGPEVEELKKTGIKTAIITNASLLWKPDVREELMLFDWVSLKLDSVDYETWKKIDRPYKKLNLEEIKNGMKEFASHYTGELVTETMLVKGYNTDETTLTHIAEFLHELNPAKSYLAIPTRPPANSKIQQATEQQLAKAFQIFSKAPGKTEYLNIKHTPMRKLQFFALAASLFILTATANAQRFDGGIIAGLSTSQIDGDNSAGYERIDLIAGGWVSTALNKNFSIRAELAYIGKGSKIVNPNISEKRTVLRYVEFPLFIRYHFWDDFTFALGPAPAFLFASKILIDGNESNNTKYSEFHTFDLAGTAELGYFITPKIQLSARWSYSVLPFRNNPNWHNRNLEYTVSYTF